MKALLAALCLIVLPGVASAHGLSVFAFRQGETLGVEAKFANGRAVQQGLIRILDADDQVVFEGPVSGEETTFVPLVGDERGLWVEVDAGNDHFDYWILTPSDLAE